MPHERILDNSLKNQLTQKPTHPIWVQLTKVFGQLIQVLKLLGTLLWLKYTLGFIIIIFFNLLHSKKCIWNFY